MSIAQRTWRYRNRMPRCDQCGDRHLLRQRTEVDWKHQTIKVIWHCTACDNHVYVYAQRGDATVKQVA